MSTPLATYFMGFQRGWLNDPGALRICEKSRQIGMSYADSYDSVRKVSTADAKLDVWVSSRDEEQAKQYLLYCKGWAKILNLAAQDLGQVLIDRDKDLSAFVLRFANGLNIYSLSSNPDAIAGKTGHIKLDEFALHRDQRTLYRIAKPATQWGGQLSIISTHRGVGTVFNEIIRDIKERGNPMGWSLHTIPIQRAVDEGLVERIARATGKTLTRESWLAQIRKECLDEEQWQQEYCCVPSDDSTAFLTYDLIASCVAPNTLRDIPYLETCPNPLYLGMDIARRSDLTVIDVGEKIGDVVHDRLRLEMRNTTFAEQEHHLHRLLALPRMQRACIDATGMGEQLAERAQARWGWKVEPIRFTAPVKEQLAYPLKADFENRLLRIEGGPVLVTDLRGIKKEVGISGNIRFVGEAADSHCDRFWALALRQHAQRQTTRVAADVLPD